MLHILVAGRLHPNGIALLDNATRGGLIDDETLAIALKKNRLLSAGIEVLEQKPSTPNHPYADVDTAILTSHSAGTSLECAQRIAIVSVQNVSVQNVSVQNILNDFNGKLDRMLTVNSEEIGY